MAAATLTVYPEAASVHEGRLAIGGCDVLELAREFGTPAYVVAEDDLRARAREFVRALATHHGGQGRVLFAAKAFPCTAVLRIFAEEGLGVDVASAGELHLALRAGFDPGRIVVHGNAKSLAELRAAVEHRLTVAIDNLDEVERLGALAGDGPQPVLLRVVPEVQTDTHHAVATGHADQKFGLTLAEAAEAIERLGDWADLRGVHVHIGSQLFDLAPYREAVAAIAGLGSFPLYDLGGGLAAAYTAEHRPPSIDEWVAGVTSAAHELLGARESRAVDRARARARRQRRRDALHRRVGQTARLDVGGGRRRHERQPAPDALRRALRRGHRRSARAPRANAATWRASTASRGT